MTSRPPIDEWVVKIRLPERVLTPEKDGEFDHPVDALRYFYINRASRRMGTVKERGY